MGPLRQSGSSGSPPAESIRLREHLCRGVEVPPHWGRWDHATIILAAQWRSHWSAKEDIKFVCDEMFLQFCAQCFWTAPPAVVTTRGRPHSVIAGQGSSWTSTAPSPVRTVTTRLAPSEAMQFGKALHCLLAKIVHAKPTYGSVYLAKIDIADGFYRIGLQACNIPRLGMILPSDNARDPSVAFPLALSMVGWVESPPYFTSVTDTTSDLLNAALRQWEPLPPHRLEAQAATPPTAAPLSTTMAQQEGEDALRLARVGLKVLYTSPLAYADVYVDDFILTAQTKRLRHLVMRTALHSTDQLVCPLSPADRPIRKEPGSVKKLRQGDACWWVTQKVFLVWDVDTVA